MYYCVRLSLSTPSFPAPIHRKLHAGGWLARSLGHLCDPSFPLYEWCWLFWQSPLIISSNVDVVVVVAAAPQMFKHFCRLPLKWCWLPTLFESSDMSCFLTCVFQTCVSIFQSIMESQLSLESLTHSWDSPWRAFCCAICFSRDVSLLLLQLPTYVMQMTLHFSSQPSRHTFDNVDCNKQGGLDIWYPNWEYTSAKICQQTFISWLKVRSSKKYL